jgi:hypothetical protein
MIISLNDSSEKPKSLWLALAHKKTLREVHWSPKHNLIKLEDILKVVKQKVPKSSAGVSRGKERDISLNQPVSPANHYYLDIVTQFAMSV